MKRNSSPAPAVRPDGLQLQEQRRFQLRFWTLERLAWGVFGLVILAALAGLTGAGGPWSQATVSLPSGAVVYPQITRWQAAEELSIQFTQRRPVHRLVLGSGFSQYFQVEGSQPDPESTRASGRTQVMEFAAEGAPPHRVVLHLRASRPGLLRVHLEIDGEAAEFASWVFP